ncbi:MAG: polysaccharide biosynthesis protein [Clostridiales bacterium]|nr:polysaccharide biosynthesis protein [Clostridiales bacterium]
MLWGKQMSRKIKTFILLFFDCACYILAYLLSIVLLRRSVSESLVQTWPYMVIGVILLISLNFGLKIYSILVRYAGLSDMIRIVCASVVMAVYNMLVSWISVVLVKEWAIILSVAVLFTTVISRFWFKIIETFKNAGKWHKMNKEEKRVMIIGAGSAGDMLIREMKTSEKYNMRPVCVLDDDPNKINRYINGVKVCGKTSEVREYAEKYGVSEIIIAMPSVNKKEISRIANECQKTNCKVKIIPGIYQLTTGQVSVSDIKPVSITDLLGREQVKVNLSEIMGYIEGKVVMVTGGGGSIGSELCRQIAMHNPAKLIILDIYENNAYDIEQELIRKLPNLNLTVLIASVRDKNKMDDVFKKYKPQIVFHAAAHKHVPLMETSPNEAVKNNVGGTLNVAKYAGEYGAERFILISTDKAVNPTNIMGATKRICEMIVQSMDKKYKTDYVAVRFGNVLGSNGSVIPLFKRQIKEGGPLTVTHKDIVRYFMTIPEAVSLVLQAGAYANGGEIFVLDMGEQVRIYDLAINMIKLSGYEPFKDIDVKVTGLRPGEKLYEERLMAEEGLKKTENEKISIGKPLEIDSKLFEKLEELLNFASSESDGMKDLVHQLVPTYVIDRRN